jgi:aspartate-semialdehyde dehydrogenase
MAPNVPLVIPEINAEHLHLIEEQPSRQESGGYMVTNPNCSTIGLVMALKPIEERFGIEQIFVTTMQAVSGAGYPGVPSMDILGNVVPYIGSEEEKMEAETLKLLGKLSAMRSRRWPRASAPLQSRRGRGRPHRERLHQAGQQTGPGHARGYSCRLGRVSSPRRPGILPTAPEQPIQWAPQHDRPQPRLDRNRGNGMAVTVGRLRPCGVLDWKFTALSHNTIRGAAGATILNAELLASLGKL